MKYDDERNNDDDDKLYNDGYVDDEEGNNDNYLDDEHVLIFKVIEIVKDNYTGIEHNQKLIGDLVSSIARMSNRISELNNKISYLESQIKLQ